MATLTSALESIKKGASEAFSGTEGAKQVASRMMSYSISCNASIVILVIGVLSHIVVLKRWYEGKVTTMRAVLELISEFVGMVAKAMIFAFACEYVDPSMALAVSLFTACSFYFQKWGDMNDLIFG